MPGHNNCCGACGNLCTSSPPDELNVTIAGLNAELNGNYAVTRVSAPHAFYSGGCIWCLEAPGPKCSALDNHLTVAIESGYLYVSFWNGNPTTPKFITWRYTISGPKDCAALDETAAYLNSEVPTPLTCDYSTIATSTARVYV